MLTFCGIATAGMVDVVFHPTPTLVSGLTVKASESCWKGPVGETWPRPNGLVKENKANSRRDDARNLAEPRLETFKFETLSSVIIVHC